MSSSSGSLFLPPRSDILHDAGPLHRDHVSRLGPYWNAIVTHDEALGRQLASDPALAPRVAVLPYVLEERL
jgi:hypothetical protein